MEPIDSNGVTDITLLSIYTKKGDICHTITGADNEKKCAFRNR
jgi:hypothetical protein